MTWKKRFETIIDNSGNEIHTGIYPWLNENDSKDFLRISFRNEKYEGMRWGSGKPETIPHINVAQAKDLIKILSDFIEFVSYEGEDFSELVEDY